MARFVSILEPLEKVLVFLFKSFFVRPVLYRLSTDQLSLGAEIMRRPLKTTVADHPNLLLNRLQKRPRKDPLLCTIPLTRIDPGLLR